MTLPLLAGLLSSLLLSPVAPPGTRDISLGPGETWKVTAPLAAEVVCDDPAVVQAARAHGMASFTALQPGATLCAVRSVSGTPYAVYRITINR
jgi:hypothetical protein